MRGARTILKYTLNVTAGSQQVTMPRGAVPLALQMQRGAPTLWMLCDPTAEESVETIEMFATGAEAPHPDDARYLGTVQDQHGFVWHFFQHIWWIRD